MSKENPVNPNPLYPKNLGYRFLGYEFDDAWVPTFLYRAGDVEVSDRSHAVSPGDNPVLRRRLTFTSKARQELYFRALTGKVERVDEQSFTNEGLQVRLGEPGAWLRSASGGEGRELILKLDLPTGKSKILLDYELLR